MITLIVASYNGAPLAQALSAHFDELQRTHRVGERPGCLIEEGAVMSQHVCMGALLKCSFGAAPSSLVVLPVNNVLTSNQPAANMIEVVMPGQTTEMVP